MQLLFNAYNLQTCSGTIETDHFKLMWKEVNGDEKFKFIGAPVLTRWGTVGDGATELYLNYDKWKNMALALTKYKTTKSASNRIASALHSLMQEPLLKAHLVFVNTFHHSFFQGHLKWFSNIDEIAKEAGFLSRHIAIHFYCFNQDIFELISKWNVLPEFAEYKTICDKLTNEEKISARIGEYEIEFMKQSQKFLKKHFDQWRCGHLLPFVLAGDSEIATPFAKWLLFGENNNFHYLLDKEYYSSVHKCSINVKDAMNFLIAIVTMNSVYHEASYFKNHYNAIKEIASGTKVWVDDRILSHDMLLFKTYMHRHWIPFPSQTQIVELESKTQLYVPRLVDWKKPEL